MIDEQIIASCALRSCRAFRNMTQAEVAQKACLDTSAVGFIEQRTRPPTLQTLVRIAHGAFGLSIAEFMAIGEREYAGEEAPHGTS